MNHIVAGDMLRPDPAWNRTTAHKEMHLPDPVKVISVKIARSQTGRLLKVETVSGKTISLDAGWFVENTSRMTQTRRLDPEQPEQ